MGQDNQHIHRFLNNGRSTYSISIRTIDSAKLETIFDQIFNVPKKSQVRAHLNLELIKKQILLLQKLFVLLKVLLTQAIISLQIVFFLSIFWPKNTFFCNCPNIEISIHTLCGQQSRPSFIFSIKRSRNPSRPLTNSPITYLTQMVASRPCLVNTLNRN